MGAAYQAKFGLIHNKNSNRDNSFQTVVNTVDPPKLACSPHKDAYEVKKKKYIYTYIHMRIQNFNLLLLFLDLHSNG